MNALVLCAGFGKRLGPIGAEAPKPLLEVGGAPIVEHILRRLALAGVRDVFLNLHYRAEEFAPRLGDGAACGVKLTYRYEPVPLGTLGTSRNLLEETNADLLVHYGDIITDHDLGALVAQHRARGAAATILLHDRPGSNSFARLADDDRVVEFIERPETPPDAAGAPAWAFSGICVLSPDCLTALSAAAEHEAVLDLPRDLFPALARAGRLFGHRLAGYRCAIDSVARLEAAREAFATGRIRPVGQAASSMREGL